MPFVKILLQKTVINFAVAAAVVVGTGVGTVLWNKGLKKIVEDTASEIFPKKGEEEETPA